MEISLQILKLVGASPADFVIVFMGMTVVGYVRAINLRLKENEKLYHKLDKSNIRLWDRVAPGMVDEHYSGDYSIKHPNNQ